MIMCDNDGNPLVIEISGRRYVTCHELVTYRDATPIPHSYCGALVDITDGDVDLATCTCGNPANHAVDAIDLG